jgi:hypothetical protein
MCGQTRRQNPWQFPNLVKKLWGYGGATSFKIHEQNTLVVEAGI